MINAREACVYSIGGNEIKKILDYINELIITESIKKHLSVTIDVIQYKNDGYLNQIVDTLEFNGYSIELNKILLEDKSECLLLNIKWLL